MKVTIDGVNYRPETLEEAAMDETAKKLLCDVYGTLWIEGYYDGFDEHTIKFAKPLSDKMMELNKILQFNG